MPVKNDILTINFYVHRSYIKDIILKSKALISLGVFLRLFSLAGQPSSGVVRPKRNKLNTYTITSSNDVLASAGEYRVSCEGPLVNFVGFACVYSIE